MVHMHESADVAADAVIGDGTYVWANVQIRPGARVGRRCVVGRHVFIDLDVHVGDNVKIQNNAALYEGVRVEDGAFIGPYVIFTNDKVPRAINPDGTLKSKEDWQLGTNTVRYGESLGAGSVVVTGVTIGRWSMVGSGAVVTRDVPDHALMVGSPARLIGYVSANGVRCETQEDAVALSATEAAEARA